MGYGLGGYGSPIPSDPGMGKDWDEKPDKPAEKVPEKTSSTPESTPSEPMSWWECLLGGIIIIVIITGFIWLVRWLILSLLH